MQKREINAKLAPQPASAYSQAVVVNDGTRILYISGQLGMDTDGTTPSMYALDAKAAMFRRAWRLLPALAAILIPASVLSKKSAMLSRSASERISLCFFALVSTRTSA